MVLRPPHLNSFEFVLVSALRAQQLRAGSVPRLGGEHSTSTMAQMEVAGGRVARSDTDPSVESPRQAGWQI